MKYLPLGFIMMVFLLSVQCAGNGAGGLTPGNMRCEYRVNPLGIDAAHPRLSWIVTSELRSQAQSAYRILAAGTKEALESGTGDLWDSGVVQSNGTFGVRYEGSPLASGQRAWWKLMVWDGAGKPSDWSEPAFWEMGMLGPEDWQGKWIGYPPVSAPHLRREFTVEREIARARVYVCGLGYYEAYLNGTKIGDHVLDPAQTDYEQRALYTVYDVTRHLRMGDNAIGVILGNGWYNQTVVNHGEYGWVDCSYGDPRLLLRLEIEFAGGGGFAIVSGEDWRCHGGPIRADNVYAGERYDARLDMPGWSSAGFDDSGWDGAELMEPPGGVLASQIMPPIRTIESIRPVSVSEPEPGIFVYDMGQNFAGWARLSLAAEEGTTVSLRFAEEIFEDGMIDPASTGVFALRLVQADTFTCRGGGTEVWEPRFTYHGFRYVEMRGFPGTPDLGNLSGVVVHTALEKAGNFESSDGMLNRIHDTALWTERSNLHGIPTDCPAREKCGWLGDAHITAEMVIYNWDAALFWEKYLGDIETSRRGGVPDNIAPGRRHGGTAADWATAFIQIPWYLYLYYGDPEPAREHYDGMKTVMEYFQAQSKNHILTDGLGDWCPPGSVRPVDTPVSLSSTAFYYFDAGIMKSFARLFGMQEEERHFEALENEIKKAFISEFYDAGLRTYGSQTADALALYLGLHPEGHGPAIAASLSRNVMETHGGHLAAGIFGSRHLYGALGDSHPATALTILRQKTYPGFGHLFSQGATTLWETWDKDETGGAHGPRSHNHPMQGGFDAWFYSGIGGIRPDATLPGFRHIILEPQLSSELHSAGTRYNSICGPIESEWNSVNSRFDWLVSIPANTTATLRIPCGPGRTITEGGRPIESREDARLLDEGESFSTVSAGSGTYRFIVSRDDAR